MLALKPNCEWCDRDLPPDTDTAVICSYECTFCTSCAELELASTCPNCGGNLTPRPIRPKSEHRPGLSLRRQPASEQRVNTRLDKKAARAFCYKIADIDPINR